MSLKKMYEQILNNQAQNIINTQNQHDSDENDKNKGQNVITYESYISNSKNCVQASSRIISNQFQNKFGAKDKQMAQIKKLQQIKIGSIQNPDQLKIIMQNLLILEQKWIKKQSQIKEYVQNLLKTIEKKDFKIQRFQLQRIKFENKIEQIEQQKTTIMKKLNQIHENLKQLNSYKKQQELRNTQKFQNQSQENQYKRKDQNKQRNNHSHSKSFSKANKSQCLLKQNETYKKKYEIQRRNNEIKIRQSQMENIENMEGKIMTNIMKILEQNLFDCSRNSTVQSVQSKFNDNMFYKDQAQIRVTTSTDDASVKKFGKSFSKKNLNMDQFIKNQNKQLFLQPNVLRNYRSAKTITFNRQQDQQEPAQFNNLNNKIQPALNNIQHSSKDIKKQNSQSLPQINRKQKNTITSQVLNVVQKGRYQNIVHTNAVQDYSLSSSLISVSDIEYSQVKRFKISEIGQHNLKNQIILSKKQQKNEDNQAKLQRKQRNIKNQSQQTNQQMRIPIKQYKKEILNQGNQIKKQNQITYKQMNFTNGFLKKSKPLMNYKLQISSGLVNSNFYESLSQDNNKQNIETKKQFEHQNKQPINQKQSQSQSQRENIYQEKLYEKQIKNQIENTEIKKQIFEQTIKNNNDRTLAKSKNYKESSTQNYLSVGKQSNEKQINPETKCNSFQQSISGQNFFQKTYHSDQPFKSVQINNDFKEKSQISTDIFAKMKFQNNVLKSYNHTLEKQANKLKTTQKLREKFKTQNLTILNKINSKKSIF